ncbi:hypothetical protein NP233_g5607 [Leucocoprinus birnbaumii]|uniref:Uncharacterized protein n=1 Tax=Leucocoprinus birnbaumii TaxID=56174 RepID=A0AAD5YWJ5_9AGAR|nr:hypothetical protein NP233_g5607 [Leucocoprinus birnbaumii]
MLGLDGYGSGSESESEHETPKVVKSQPTPSVSTATSKSKFSLPPPSNGSSASKLSLPAPKTTKRAPKKITIGLPTLSKDTGEEKDDLESERPAPKRQKMSGAGASGLLSMLPAPKQKAPVAPQPERVLGGGKGPGLVFNTRPSAPLTQPEAGDEEGNDEGSDEDGPALTTPAKLTTFTPSTSASSLPFLPPSLAKGKANISLEDKPKAPLKPSLPSVSAAPAVDLFSLGNSKSTASDTTPGSSFSIPTLSSAPALPTFEPPEPTPQDQYPGYYQLPSGQWAAYEAGYYEKFRRKWQKEYDDYVRGLEKGTLKGFEGYEDSASEVDAMKEMEKARVEIKEREERKALSKGATGPAEEPRMKFNASKLSGIARSRHQLSTLLRDAYENREALEEKIAEGRRNRKEAGNKYGFYLGAISSATMQCFNAPARDRDTAAVDIYTRSRISRTEVFSAERTGSIVLNYHGNAENSSRLYVEREVTGYMPLFPELPERNTIGEMAPLTSLVRSVVDLDRVLTRQMTRNFIWSPDRGTRNVVVKFKPRYDSELPERLVLQIDEVHRSQTRDDSRRAINVVHGGRELHSFY